MFLIATQFAGNGPLVKCLKFSLDQLDGHVRNVKVKLQSGGCTQQTVTTIEEVVIGAEDVSLIKIGRASCRERV